MIAPGLWVGQKHMQVGERDEYFADQEAEAAPATDSQPAHPEEQWGDEPEGERPTPIVPILLIVLSVAWTGFFLFAHWPELTNLPAPARVGELITGWTVPLLLIGLIWLLVLRTSHREAKRFVDVSTAMHRSGNALQNRVQAINNEISLAREFLAEQARELDMLGRTRARDIREAAETLQSAFGESVRQAEALDAVSNNANGNLERLRNHLPVVTSTAKDVTNQIAAAGSAAHQQVEELLRRSAEVEEASARLGEAIDMLAQRSEEAHEAIGEHGTSSEQRIESFLRTAEDAGSNLKAAMQSAIADLLASLDDSADRQRRLAIETADSLRTQLGKLDDAIVDVGQRGGEQGDRISRLAMEIDESAEKARARIAELDKTGSDATARIAFAISAALENSDALSNRIMQNDGALSGLGDHMERLKTLLDGVVRQSENALHPSVERLNLRIEETRQSAQDLSGTVDGIDGTSRELAERTAAFGSLLTEHRKEIEQLLADSGAAFAERRADGKALERALMEARGALQRLAEDVETRLSQSVEQVRDRSIEAADHARGALDGVVEQSAETLRLRTGETLSAAVEEEMADGAAQWDALVRAALERSDETTQLLQTRLAKLEQMTSNLEVRLERAHEQFDGIDDDAFARRMLLLTESLNSTSIDVAKLLSNEVTDTAWAAYLKGDRGVFTRRAVRLLDAGEVRVVAQHYEEDAEFRSQVNRYIHDFESIMRSLMSTRDGSAISVTLLSSDVGKLYVALAQAIERLRT
ncbi:hypothetical protein [Novosphingopyxis sp. YJ-S2-01]|uniref:hypothetical protein n=1 Tax=Novosphingopyxis sp. YJ-S2-01 TaxID=2794021 RepID=UPI0018DCA85A|nr:hypothetical protein [Novosphingopyxis sp. YJ-S2-01]MBH9538106.1 hypothetical protein [Novosphingopyxis sp. YJ-S2-01]